MTQSVTTLFVLMNECLREIGERPFEVDDDETNTRILARQCVKSALYDFAREANWLFLRETRTAIAWNLERADIGEYNRLYQVQSRQFGLWTIPQVSIESFYNLDVIPYSVTIFNQRPTTFAILNEREIVVSPYPVTIPDRDNLLFLVQANLIMPPTDNDVFNMPEHIIGLFKLKVCMHLALKHLSDRETVQNFAGVYVTALRDAVNMDNSRSPNSANMFRRKAGGQLW